MDWLLIAWFVTSVNSSFVQQAFTTRTNTEDACRTVLNAGYQSGLRGLCIYDPARGQLTVPRGEVFSQ